MTEFTDDRLTRFDGTVIETKQLRTVLDEIDLHKRFGKQHSEAQCLLLTGGARVGKTFTLQRYMADFPKKWVDNEGWQRPVMKTNAPIGCTLKALSAKILSELGGIEKRGEREEAQTNRVIEMLRTQKVDLLMIDEAHHMMKRNTENVIWDASEWLKELLNSNVCSIVLAGLQRTVRLYEVNPQLQGRSGGMIELTGFRWNDPEERSEFIDVIATLHEILELAGGVDLTEERVFTRIFMLTDGHVGLIKRLIRGAFIRSIQAGDTGLSWAALVASADALIRGRSQPMQNPFRIEDQQIRMTVP